MATVRLPDARGVANSQGAPFGLCCASAGLVSALALVSPVDEVAHPLVKRQLPHRMRQLVDDVVRDPYSAEVSFAAFEAATMFAMVMGEVSESDRSVYRDEAFVKLFRAALDEGFAQGPSAYAHQTRLAMSHWGLDLASISVPVSIWFGRDDVSHSPDRGFFLAERIPCSRRHVVNGMGGSLLWRAPAPIVDELLSLAAAERS